MYITATANEKRDKCGITICPKASLPLPLLDYASIFRKNYPKHANHNLRISLEPQLPEAA